MTPTLEAPLTAVAVTAEGATRVPVVAWPVPPPNAVQAAHAVPETNIRTVSRTPTRRARTPRLGAARRARVFGGVRVGITAVPSRTR
ncbi:hypothetical protein GCM10009721_06290 [Terrabacter tumescens]|uniref:Uncharacterized protein n=1 Tax=Terrabacter tumescens TaxID=60443 RepID=A0ABQ2HL83_9MICO|nr:hypothetical protein GCM10009721_06290 [Terrabacter tumescens]